MVVVLIDGVTLGPSRAAATVLDAAPDAAAARATLAKQSHLQRLQSQTTGWCGSMVADDTLVGPNGAWAWKAKRCPGSGPLRSHVRTQWLDLACVRGSTVQPSARVVCLVDAVGRQEPLVRR